MRLQVCLLATKFHISQLGLSFNIKQRYQNKNACIIFETIRFTVMKHVSVKGLPTLNGAVTRTVWRARASRRTGGKLIMWKMKAWKASVGVGMGADEGCPPCARRSWPDWEQDQHCDLPFCLPVCPHRTPISPPPNVPITLFSIQ